MCLSSTISVENLTSYCRSNMVIPNPPLHLFKQYLVQKPKQAVFTVTSMKCGVVNANMVGNLPCNRRQVYNIKNNESDENDL